MKERRTRGHTGGEHQASVSDPERGSPLAQERHKLSPAGLLDLVRLAGASLWGRDACVVVWEAQEPSVKIATPQRLTAVDLQRLESEVRSAAAGMGVLQPGQPLEVLVNGAPANGVDEGGEANLVQVLSMPLSIGGEPSGVLVLGAFSRLWTNSQAKLVRQMGSEVTGALRLLWTLVVGERDRHRALVRNSMEGYLLCDWQKHIVLHNPAALELLALPTEGDQRATLTGAMESLGLLSFLEEAMQNGIFELNKIFTTGDQRERIVGAKIKLLREGRGNEIGWLVTLRDVTAPWEVDRMKSMLAVASHEINTPLASVQSTTDLLLENEIGELNEQQIRCLKMIRGDVIRLRQLLKDMLDLSVLDRDESNLERRRYVKLPYIARKVADSFEWLAKERQVELSVTVPETLPDVQGDRDRITQVLVNLVDNALRFTPAGGKVELSGEERPQEIVLRVRDTGVGIAADDLHRIFDRFEQSDNLPPGIERGYGLGLSIAREIVEQHHGRLWVESKPGKGSTFHLKIPK